MTDVKTGRLILYMLDHRGKSHLQESPRDFAFLGISFLANSARAEFPGLDLLSDWVGLLICSPASPCRAFIILAESSSSCDNP